MLAVQLETARTNRPDGELSMSPRERRPRYLRLRVGQFHRNHQSHIYGRMNLSLDNSGRSVLVLVQARMESERFPGKMMTQLAGEPMLTHVLRRVKAAKSLSHRILALPDTPANDVLAAIGIAEGFDVHRGSMDDVLARFWWASQRYPDDKVIVRITADDPMKDPGLIDDAVGLFLQEWANPTPQTPHYLHLGGPTWPLGLDVEVFSRGALDGANERARDPVDREHVTRYMAATGTSWVVRDPHQRGSIAMRWTVDTLEDLENVRPAFDALYAKNPLFGYDDILAWAK